MIEILSHFSPPSADVIFKKRDPEDLRLGDYVEMGREVFDRATKEAPKTDSLENPHQELQNAFALFGYPDDEGIDLGKGRPGAAHGPTAIRKAFYKMTPALGLGTPPRLLDFGNLNTKNMPLKDRHERGADLVQLLLGHDIRVATMGGGHDYGYADGAGFLRSFQDPSERPLIFNFDAHLDVRPPEGGLNSGTPFYRLLQNFEGQFDLGIAGVQRQCNSSAHFQWVVERGARVLTLDELLFSGSSMAETFLRFFEPWLIKSRPVFLSVDMDSFSAAYAPGCSQSFATGFEPRDFFQIFEVISKRWDIRVMGVYETSPPLDADDRTARLAAQILHRYAQLSP